jgi:hypothetical protein
MRESRRDVEPAGGEGREAETLETHFRRAVKRASSVKTNLLEWEIVMEISRNLVLPEEVTMTDGARQAD